MEKRRRSRPIQQHTLFRPNSAKKCARKGNGPKKGKKKRTCPNNTHTLIRIMLFYTHAGQWKKMPRKPRMRPKMQVGIQLECMEVCGPVPSILVIYYNSISAKSSKDKAI